MFMNRILRAAGWVTKFELWIVLATAPILLFPLGRLPFLCLFIYAVVWICRKISSGHFSHPTNLDIPIILLVLTLILGYWISINPEMSWARVWSYLLGVFIFYSLVNALRPAAHWQVSVILITLLTVGIVLFSLVSADWSAVRLFKIPWLYAHFPALLRNIPGSGVPQESDLINPRAIGITLGSLLPFLIPFLVFYSKGKFRLILLIGSLLAFLNLLITQSLQGLVGLVAGLTFIAIWRNRKFALLIPLGLVLCSGLFFALGVQKTLIYLLSVDNPVGIAVALRLDMWSRALAMIRDMPFTGIGLNIFPIIQSNFYPGYIIGPEVHAHNLFLQTALDQGLPGLGAMIFLFFAWGITIKRHYNQASQPGQRILYVALAAAIISYLTQGFLDVQTLGAKPAPIIWIFLGIGAAPVALPLLENKTIPGNKIPWLRVVLPLVFFFAIIGSILIFNPAAVYSNRGSLLAHQFLYQPDLTSSLSIEKAKAAREDLVRAIALDPDESHLHQVLGRLDGWLGDDQTALTELSKSVELDGQDPYWVYFPPAFILRQMKHDNDSATNWDDLLDIYSHWVDRFPQRAEGYLLCSIVSARQKHDLKNAETYLVRGLDQKAAPRWQLQYYLERLKDPSYEITKGLPF
jgi:putative inorganic carbon (HCO3(-)) transporter